MDAAPSPAIIRFGVFELNLRTGELWKSGVKLRLQQQPLQVLQVLIEYPGEMVTREELRLRVWPADTFVEFDQGLNNAIKRLRDTLGDNAHNPRYVETLPRRGFRFIAPVIACAPPANGDSLDLEKRDVVLCAEPVPAPSEPKGSRSRLFALPAFSRKAGAVMALVLTVAILAIAIGRSPGVIAHGRSGRQIRSVAVLPLHNMSGDSTQDYFADGMTTQLIADFSKIAGLRVISWGSIRGYKKTEKTPGQIAEELRVDAIVEGAVVRSANRVRITAELLDPRDGRDLWANSYDRDPQEALSISSDIVRAVGGEMNVRINAGEAARLRSPRSVNAKALDEYLEGVYQLNEGNAADDADQSVHRAIELWRRALVDDPMLARAHLAIAGAYYNLLARPSNRSELQRAEIEEALKIDPELADAHSALACLKLNRDWDWSGAEQEFRKALSLDPNSVSAHAGLAHLSDLLGRSDEALAEFALAEERNPNDLSIPMSEWRSVAFRRKYGESEAINRFRKLLQAHPDDSMTHLQLYELYADNGMESNAMRELQRFVAGFGFEASAERFRQAYVKNGYRAATLAYARELGELSDSGRVFRPFMVAEAYARLGDRENTWKWLQKSYAAREDYLPDFLTVNSSLRSFRSDPRYAELVHRVGLPLLAPIDN